MPQSRAICVSGFWLDFASCTASTLNSLVKVRCSFCMILSLSVGGFLLQVYLPCFSGSRPPCPHRHVAAGKAPTCCTAKAEEQAVHDRKKDLWQHYPHFSPPYAIINALPIGSPCNGCSKDAPACISPFLLGLEKASSLLPWPLAEVHRDVSLCWFTFVISSTSSLRP